MRLTVKKLGPLREATVDLSKRLIVLTGPNNAGKTWLAWCVYALATLPTEELAPVVKPFAEELLASPQRRLDATRSEALWKAVIDAVPAVLKRWLPIVFALPEEHFAETELGFESSANHRSLSSGFYASEDERATLLVLSVSRRQVELGVAQRTSQLLTPRTVPAIDVDVDAQLVIKQLTDSAWHILAPRALIFPAERAGIQLVARELAAERSRLLNELLVRRRVGEPSAELTESVMGLPLPISDFHQFALQRRNRMRHDLGLDTLADRLEDTVLGGRLEFHDDASVTLNPAGASRSLPLASSSAAAKSLAQVVRLVRQHPSRNEVVIVDEPEQNLHPDKQVVVARSLVELTHEYASVMLSTHSDYVLREINHCVMAAHPSPHVRETARSLGYDEAVAIKPSEVGAYFLHDGVAEELPVTETGFQVPSIDAVIEAQSLAAQSLYAAIDESHEALPEAAEG